MDGLLTFLWLTAIRIVLPVAGLLVVGTWFGSRRTPEGEGPR